MTPATIHVGDRVKCKGKRGDFVVVKIGPTLTLTRTGQFHAAYPADVTVSVSQRRFNAALERIKSVPAMDRLVRSGRANDMTDDEIMVALKRVVFGD